MTVKSASVHRGSLIHRDTAEVSCLSVCSWPGRGGSSAVAASTHVPRTSLKSKIFLMSSTCFFHVSPLPASPFSRAMAPLHRPRVRPTVWGGGAPGGWEDAGKRRGRGKGKFKPKRKKKKIINFLLRENEARGSARGWVFVSFSLIFGEPGWCAFRCGRTM